MQGRERIIRIRTECPFAARASLSSPLRLRRVQNALAPCPFFCQVPLFCIDIYAGEFKSTREIQHAGLSHEQVFAALHFQAFLHNQKEKSMMSEVRNTPHADNPQKDWFLQFLVNMANKSHFELQVSLNVGGFVISGTLAGVKQYFADFGTDFASSFYAGKSSEEIRTTFQKIGDECACVSKSEPSDSPSYIHLKDARFFDAQGNSIGGHKGVWWRGRISEVQGFVPGTMSKPAGPSAE